MDAITIKDKPHFVTPLRLQLNEDEESWTVIDPLIYVTNIPVNGKYVIIVPAGFVTDLASVPRVPFAYLLAGGKAQKAAVVHDYLYVMALGSKEDADNIFKEAMGVSKGISSLRKNYMHKAVSLFGRGNYEKKIKQEEENIYGS
jgi:hypothetical protein